jgi:hypothetical protein
VTTEPTAKVFDMPHARVTLTPVGPNVEIEVWPKQGQSAYAVVDPAAAILIARHLAELAAAQIAAARAAAMADGEDESEQDADEDAVGAGGSDEDEDGDERSAAAAPDNIVDLASRRRTGGPTPA